MRKCVMPYANNKGADQPVHPRMDFSKAFDKGDHNFLIYKLFNLGLNSLIKSFLKNRNQSVVVKGKQSSSVPVISGVPPRICIGALSFSCLYT